jgi:hypothetical protein
VSAFFIILDVLLGAIILRFAWPNLDAGARFLELELSRQAGADDLKTYFPELKVPFGVTWHDLEVAEQMVFDWENGGDYRAFGLAIKIYECLRAAVLAAE